MPGISRNVVQNLLPPCKVKSHLQAVFQAPWDAALGLVGPMGLVGLGGFHHATGRWVGAVKRSRQLDVGPRFEEVPTNRQLKVAGSDASMWGRRQRLEVNWDPGLSKTCQTSKLSSSIMPSLWWVTIRARNRLTCCKGFSANISYIMSEKWVSMKIVVKESEPG